MTLRYTIPVVLQDMAPAEALLQTFDSLQHLNESIGDVFARLQNRISSERAKVSQVGARVAAAKDKVQKVSENQNKVTQIYSPAKLPSAKVLPDFKRVWDEQEDHALRQPRRTQYLLTTKQRKEEPQPVDTTELFTSLSKARATRQDVDRRGEAEATQEGLGRLPSYLPSISSILLFNSDENPYKKYISFNNLEGKGGKDRDKGINELAAAPKSLFDGTGLPTFAGLQYEYKPDLGQVPTFALPQNLPLGRLADISFGLPGEAHVSIAPSVASLPSLPSLEQFKALPAPKNIQPAPSSAAPPVAPAAAPPVAPAAPPPPGPPSAPAPPAPPMNAPPAPPMAPPPAAPEPPTMPANNDGDKDKDKGTSDEGEDGGSRGDLMAAIRNRAKIKLKKVEPGANGDAGGSANGDGGPKPAAAKAKAPPPQMDMMSALKERLARRNLVMSGKADAEAVGPEGASGPTAGVRLSVPRPAPKGGLPAPPGALAPGARLTPVGSRGPAKKAAGPASSGPALPSLGESKRGPGPAKAAAESKEPASTAEDDDTAGPPLPSMSDEVMKAYVQQHANRQAKPDRDAWDD